MKIISGKQKEKDKFELICRDVLKFLETDFGCKIDSIKRDVYGTYIIYRNFATAISVSFTPLDGDLLIFLIKLIKDEIPVYPNNHFDFTDLLFLRASRIQLENPSLDEIMRDEIVLRQVLIQKASFLKKYASDVLSGDFSVFPELEKIVKARAKKLKKD